MIQAQKDANIKEQKPEDQVPNSSAPRTVAAAAVRTVHVDPRRSYVTNALGAQTTVILSEGGSHPESGTYQYHRVALGTQLQHVVTPVQVTGGNTTVVSDSSLPVNSRCVVTSSQDLAHILVAVTTNSTLHSLDRQTSTVSASACAPQQAQTIGTIANVVTSNQRTASGTILAQSVPQTSLPQRIVLNSSMSDVLLRLSPSAGTGGASPQFMVLESSAGLVPSSDVTKVHSYSLASAAVSALSSSGAMQKVVISTPGQHIQAAGLPHKAILTPAAHSQMRTAAKRMLSPASSVRPDVSTSVNSVVDVMSRLSVVNKLLSGLIACEGKIPSIPSSPKQKRIKLDKTLISKDNNKRKKIMDHFTRKLRLLQFKYYNQQAEYFFLKNGGNIMDHIVWKKKFPAELVEYLRANRFDPFDDVKNITDCLTKWFSGVPSSGFPGEQLQPSKSNNSSSSHPQSPSSRIFSSPSSNRSADNSGSPVKGSRPSVVSHKQLSKQNSISSVYDSQIGSQEEIVERAKQEAYVMQRVGDLRKEGLWSLKRLPKVAETPRIKAHWDYLLEEMVWLATDFAQERKWKKAAAKKCARMITKYFQEKEIKAEKAEKEEQMRLRKIASVMAREIKQFWSNIEKLVEYKQQTWLEEKRKKVLDVHLNYIVDQTEKYSSWLTQGMNRSLNDSPESSRPSSPRPNSVSSVSKDNNESSDFEPEKSESDDEETINKEEEDLDESERNEEIKLLQQESEMSLEDFLETLPPEILNSSSAGTDTKQKDFCDGSTSDLTQNIEKEDDSDNDFEVSGDEEDDEQTILEEEMMEVDVDHEKEIKELEAENELSIEELKMKYSAVPQSEEQEDETFDDDHGSSSDEQNEDNDRNEENQQSLEYNDKGENPSKDISDIAAAAESFQPKGNTLSTTQVCTKVPFLLKHTLREYQHIGLDWLNAMYDKKLNGILADEMGLGKTIQTISVLAHLACEKGVWGPHLIVVPTSVMLNWEMEFKKWCPAFKILTYYGTPKERKLKRVGWTKPNAFHVCITSYKLVIQDHQSFRRKKWKYLILDEAHHIKNFKSQRWQMLLNFQTSHRLLLTGTPLQNNLMELWSLMHFLMPNVFQSHKEFKEWFVNPVTGMIDGSHEYNENLIKRLHKVLRPFLLRRLKCEVEKQLPKKYEHVIMCRLSKRQRYLYDDFMSQTKTKETLATGNFMSVINILMQLRKVCNHPNMFEERPTISSFLMEGIVYKTASLVHNALQFDPTKEISLYFLNLLLADLEILLTAYAAHRVKKFQTPPKLIIELDSMPEPPPPCPSVKLKVNFCNSQASDKSSPARPLPASVRPSTPSRLLNSPVTNPSQRLMVIPGQQGVARSVNPVSAINQGEQQQYTLQLVQPGTAVASLAPLGGLTLQLQPNASSGNRVQCIQSLIGGIGRMVQTASGAQFLITSVGNSVPEQQLQTTVTTTVAAQPTASSTSVTTSMQSVVIGTNIATATVMPQVHKAGNAISPSFITSFNRPPVTSTPASSSPNQSVQATHNKPIGRVAPLNVHPPSSSSSGAANNVNHVQPVKSPVVHSLSKPVVKQESDSCDKSTSLFYLDQLASKRERVRKDTLKALARINNRRCTAYPIYGGDLVDTISFVNSSKVPVSEYRHKWGSYLNCEHHLLSDEDPLLHLHTTRALVESIKTAAERIVELMDIIKRFVFVVPAVSSSTIKLHVAHPAPSNLNAERTNMEMLEKSLSPVCAFLHPLVSNMKTQFPELRLIQYDCGKLQRLALLLRDLKNNHHRVLIFTQMTRMLDILEQFLNYHGHTYLRLDGNTKVEQRQALMERFNADPRIFCFILSTRSGGIGVNLTGADTVIFYDSDWNPTMDAQAQDRCHRIGQTRDVHIYRLISERTVEENILKKANEKRLLGDLAIEGGNFNTAFFKKNTIHELFGIEVHDNSSGLFEEKVDISKDVKESVEIFSQSQLEQALGMAEEETDLQAAKTAHAEAAAELAEFDESIPLDNDSRENEEKSPAEEELEKLMEQLTPVEKYAVHFLESLQEPLSLEQLKLAEEEIEAQKKDWELGHLKALKEEEEKRLGVGDEDSLLFCSRDSSNQMYFSVNGQEEMPIWAPPTPPTSENDIYLDPCLAFWYEPSVMHESRLPPVFIKKEPKRQHVDPVVSATTTARKQKVRKDDMVNIPRSLFDRPSAAILKMRREVKLQKVKGLMVGASALNKPVSPFVGLKQPPVLPNKPAPDVYPDKPEWLVREDFGILQVIQDQQGIPLSLTILMPAHIPNWDLSSDFVDSSNRIHRSARLCKNRYENVIMLREEGKILYDTNPKKPKKTKGIYKTKNNRPMKTSHLHQQDNNMSVTNIFSVRDKVTQEMAQKRKMSERQSCLQTSKGPKMVSVLSDNAISYDEPLHPMQIALNRAERIAREKQKNQPATAQGGVSTQVTAQTVVQVTEHPANQRQVPQQSTVTVTGAASLIPHQAQAVIASFQAQQLQQVQLSKANLQPGSATSVSLPKSLTNSIMVNTTPGAAAGTFATITKALGQAGSLSAQGTVQNAAIAAALSNASLRNQRTSVTGTGTTTTMTVQEMVAAAAAAGQVRSLTTTTSGTSTAPAVVSVAGLATVQLAASQRITGTAATTVATAVANQMNSQITTQRNITQLSPIQAIRHPALIRQQREHQTLKQQQLKRLQVQQQQAATQPAAKVAVGATGALTVAAAQQRVAPQQVTMKSSRPLTDAEMTQFVKRQQLQQQQKQVQLTTAQILAQAQLQQVQPQQVSITGGTATLVKTVSAPSSVAIPVSAVTMSGVNINVSMPQGKTGAVQTKGATTITNQQLRQFQIQQQLLNQARKGKNVATNITQLAKVPNKGSAMSSASISTPVNAVQIVQHNPSVGNTQQVKGLPTAMTVQQIQQAMKALPQNLPVVVTATPSLPGIQHSTATLRGEPGVVASSVKAQTTTLPSTTLTTSGVLKGTPAVVVGQQQTAAILQQVAASSAALSGQHAVTLAVRATASQAQGQQQVQIQVQPSAHSSLVSAQSQVVSPQTRIQQLSQNASTINIAPPVAVQNVAQASSILSPSAAIVQQMPADSTIQSPTHVVMHSVAITNSTATPTALSSPQTTSVQAVIQAARQQQQQQQAAAQQQKASPYTMRLRNPPK